MATDKTYGIKFPFSESPEGKYLSLTKTPEEEIRANLIHLILTRKGSRYYLPNFGTRLYEFIFEPMDSLTFDSIRADIKESVDRFIPNLQINSISITPYTKEESSAVNDLYFEEETETYEMYDIYRTAGEGVEEYTAKVKIDYSIKNTTFENRDLIIINI